MGSLTVVDEMQMELDRLQNVEYAMRRLNAELQVKVEDLEAQLLENTDLGWHNLRNQRDDLLKRVDELRSQVEDGCGGETSTCVLMEDLNECRIEIDWMKSHVREAGVDKYSCDPTE